MDIQEIAKHFPQFAKNLSLAEKALNKASVMRSEADSNRKENMLWIRGSLGMSAKKFGSMCGVTQQYIFALESGRARWNERMIARFNLSLKDYYACPTGSEPAEQAGG